MIKEMEKFIDDIFFSVRMVARVFDDIDVRFMKSS